MKELVFLMHVPWNSIKQRPHYVAEQLSVHRKVSVFYVGVKYNPPHLNPTRRFPDLRVGQLHGLRPTGKPMFQMHRFNVRNLMRLSVQLNDDCLVWITHPNLYYVVKFLMVRNNRIFYDCMDDLPEFPHIKNDVRMRTRVLRNEQKLVERCSAVFCSSETLRKALERRYHPAASMEVVNNAAHTLDFTDSPLPPNVIELFKPGTITLCYVGTIAEWIDFDLIIESLRRFDTLSYVFVGPTTIDMPRHPRIFYAGQVNHQHVGEVLKLASVLVLPFKLNTFIESVDPVKMYEYIGRGKPVVALKYRETEKFEPFVHLYKDASCYFDLLSKAAAGELVPKAGPQLYEQFAASNDWAHRAINIEQVLSEFE